jgi:hypothetical protein
MSRQTEIRNALLDQFQAKKIAKIFPHRNPLVCIARVLEFVLFASSSLDIKSTARILIYLSLAPSHAYFAHLPFPLPPRPPRPPMATTSHTVTTPPKAPTVLRLRLWMCSCLAFLVLAPIVSIFIGLNLHVRDFKNNDKPSVFTSRTVRLYSMREKNVVMLSRSSLRLSSLQRTRRKGP